MAEITQVAVALIVDGNLGADWAKGDAQALMNQLGHPEALERTQILCYPYSQDQEGFITLSRRSGNFERKTVEEIAPDVKGQKGPMLYITRDSWQDALRYCGTLARSINESHTPFKGGTLKAIVLGLTAEPGTATA